MSIEEKYWACIKSQISADPAQNLLKASCQPAAPFAGASGAHPIPWNRNGGESIRRNKDQYLRGHQRSKSKHQQAKTLFLPTGAARVDDGVRPMSRPYVTHEASHAHSAGIDINVVG